MLLGLRGKECPPKHNNQNGTVLCMFFSPPPLLVTPPLPSPTEGVGEQMKGCIVVGVFCLRGWGKLFGEPGKPDPSQWAILKNRLHIRILFFCPRFFPSPRDGLFFMYLNKFPTSEFHGLDHGGLGGFVVHGCLRASAALPCPFPALPMCVFCVSVFFKWVPAWMRGGVGGGVECAADGCVDGLGNACVYVVHGCVCVCASVSHPPSPPPGWPTRTPAPSPPPTSTAHRPHGSTRFHFFYALVPNFQYKCLSGFWITPGVRFGFLNPLPCKRGVPSKICSS